LDLGEQAREESRNRLLKGQYKELKKFVEDNPDLLIPKIGVTRNSLVLAKVETRIWLQLWVIFLYVLLPQPDELER
jgi:hypothetical protein